jgi:hypothetical protein
MPQKVSFNVRQPSSEHSATVEAEFADDEIDRLKAYCDYVDQLLKIRLVEAGIPCELNVNYTETEGITLSTKLPPEDDVMALLHGLRPVILNDEHGSFNRICGILQRRIEEPLVRNALKRQRQIYDGRRMQEQLIVTSSVNAAEAIINSEESLFKWLNAFEYHRDQDKKAEIEKFHQLVPLDFSKAIFLMMISDKVRAICNVAGLAQIVIGKRNTTFVGG